MGIVELGEEEKKKKKPLLGSDDHDKVHHGLLGSDPHGPKFGEEYTAKALKTKEESWKELQSLGSFHRFMETHGRNYSSKKEYKHRYGVFKQNMKKVQFLRESEQGTAEYGHTIFADFTEMEFKQYTGMAIWKGKRLSDDPEIHWPPAMIPNVDLPEDGFDWRQHGAVSEVKNQVMLIHVSRMNM